MIKMIAFITQFYKLPTCCRFLMWSSIEFVNENEINMNMHLCDFEY